MSADAPCLVCGRETDCCGCRIHGTNSQQYEARKTAALAYVSLTKSKLDMCMCGPDRMDDARLRAIDAGATQDEIEKVVTHR